MAKAPTHYSGNRLIKGKIQLSILSFLCKLYFQVDEWKSFLMEELRIIIAEGIIGSANHPLATTNETMDGNVSLNGC